MMIRRRIRMSEFGVVPLADFGRVMLTSGMTSCRPKKKKKASGGGYNQPLRLSAELAALCGGEDVMSRPQVVKQVWKHIKANDLQNPNDRREIICDEVMRVRRRVAFAWESGRQG